MVSKYTLYLKTMEQSSADKSNNEIPFPIGALTNTDVTKLGHIIFSLLFWK